MKLRIDTSREYALALEGGGAKGAYEIGVWRALREAGVKLRAISGTSVGALNGALIAMGDLDRAEDIWKNIRFSQVMDVDDEEMRRLFRRDIDTGDVMTYARRAAELIKGRGFDVTPLRSWINEVVDENTVRASGIDFYIITYSVTDRKSLELRASELKDGELYDMLLASAYLPAFRNEKLGGKRYTDGGVQDAVPVHALVANGYRDIIVVRLYGVGLEKRFKMPRDARVTTIAPVAELGGVLNFDAEQSRRNLKLGYYDAQRTLYGLYGKKYYINRTWSESRAYELLRINAMRWFSASEDGCTLRELNEKLLPRIARSLDVSGGYYELFIAVLDRIADKLELPEFRVITDAQLLGEIKEASKTKKLTRSELEDALSVKKLPIIL